MENKNSSQLKLLINLLLILLLFCTYQFVYKPLQKKTENLQQENETYKQQANELTALALKEDEYRTKTKEYQDKIQQTKDKYSAGISLEKSTEFIVDLSQNTGMSVPSVSFSSDSCIFNNGETNIFQNPLTFNFIVNYSGLKKCIDYINNYPEHMSINSISASYDVSTGKLSGVIELNQYAMTGDGKQYEAPDFSDIKTGKDNIFGSGSK